MRVIIAGSRTITDPILVENAIRNSGLHITTVLSGCAGGVGRLGEAWADYNHLPVWRYPADWSAYGKAAGPIRNKEMASNADALICVWDGKSRGSRNMIQAAIAAGLPVYESRPSL